jgi:hypothetical protein
MTNFTTIPWPDKNFYGDMPSKEHHLTIELDGRLLGHKEFFESNDQTTVVYQFHYICDHDDNGSKYKCLHAGVFDRTTRIERKSWGSAEVRHFDLREVLDFKRLPDFKERDLEAEAAERVWSKFPPAVHTKYLSQATPCEHNKDGSPNFRFIGVMGPDDLQDELNSMKSDYYGEHITNSKFGVDGRTTFKSEEEAIETFWEDPKGWNIFKWDGSRWLMATMKKTAKGGREVQWNSEVDES